MFQNYDRYIRQMTMPEIGKAGQDKLNNAKVLIIGAGGLGSPVSMYLAGAGIGTIGIVDCDKVDLSNIHRQIAHTADRIGQNKAMSAADTIRSINSSVVVRTYPCKLDEHNAEDLIKEYDFIIDAVDNFEAKFLINDTCVRLGKPFCHGGIVAMHGQVLTYVPGMGPCYRCIFDEVPEPGSVPTAKDIGVVGPAVGVIGSIQALEAIKYIIGRGNLLTGKMLIFDGLTRNIRIAKFPRKSPDCKACSKY